MQSSIYEFKQVLARFSHNLNLLGKIKATSLKNFLPFIDLTDFFFKIEDDFG
jgi:hypothetical protein